MRQQGGNDSSNPTEAYQVAVDAIPSDPAQFSRRSQQHAVTALSHGIELKQQRDVLGAKAAFQQAIAFGHVDAAP